MNMLLKKSIVPGVFALLLVAWPQAATALPLTFATVPAGTVGPQSTSNPCIIAATNCSQPAGFGYNNFTSSGAISSYNMYSTTPTATVADGVQGTPYTVSQLPTAFNIAIDVNTTDAASETLTLFQVIVNGAALYTFSGSLNIGSLSSNGNGFADWLSSTVSLAGLQPTDTVLFHAVWNNAVDGGESFFIIPTTSPTSTVTTGPEPPVVPEPTSLLLLGSGLVLAHQRLRRRRAKA
jgi:hypothetical protein